MYNASETLQHQLLQSFNTQVNITISISQSIFHVMSRLASSCLLQHEKEENLWDQMTSVLQAVDLALNHLCGG